MKATLLFLVFLTCGCKVLKNHQQSVSRVDSTVSRTTHVSRNQTEARQQEQGWQEFRISGMDSVFRLPDLRIENSPVPAIPYFIQGNERIIYLPTQKVIEIRSGNMDSLVMENSRTIARLREKEYTIEKRPGGFWFWITLSIVAFVAGAYVARLLDK